MMIRHRHRRVTRQRARRLGLLVVVAATSSLVTATRSGATAPSDAEATTVVVDDSGAVAMSLPASWVDVETAAFDFGNGPSPRIMASPDNEALVSSFGVPGVLVAIPADPGTHEELMGGFGLPEGCTTLVTEDFADSTLTGIVQRGDDCGGTGAVWRTIIGDTADGLTVVAQGQAPSALGLSELNAALASLVVTAADPTGAAHQPIGTSTPVMAVTDTTASITMTVPAAWTDVAADPVELDRTTAAQPYLLAATDRQQFHATFDAPGLEVTIPNWEATHEQLLADFGLQQGCPTIETVPYADGNLTGLIQRGSGCGTTNAVWRGIAADTPDGLTIIAIGQSPTPEGQSELEAAIGSISITAEFGAEDQPVSEGTTGEPTTVVTKPGPAVPAVPSPTGSAAPGPGPAPAATDDALAPAPAGFVRVVDDTGTLTLVAPEAWSWVDTYELDIDDGKPRIVATSDLGVFQGDGDVGGALLIAEEFTPEPEALVEQVRRDESCATNGDQAYDDGTYAGWMWLGESCGPAGTGTWAVIVASPADQSVTLRLHLRAAAGEDALADQVLTSFAVVPPGAVAPAELPPRPVPPGATPTEIATVFMGALAGGDGATACSVLDPGSTGNMGLSIRGCAERVVTYYDPSWVAQVEVVGESTTSEECSASDSADPAATSASVEFAIGGEIGCVAMVREVGGEWGIEDYSGSLLIAD